MRLRYVVYAEVVHITRFRFRGFKSLYDVACDLNQLTVLTGPNGAGKSNLVDAINFLAEVAEHGIEIAVARAGGYENIAHRSGTREPVPVACGVEFEFFISEVTRGRHPSTGHSGDSNDTPLRLSLEFSIRTEGGMPASDFIVHSEQLYLRDSQGVVFRMVRGPKPDKIRFWRARRMQGRRSRYSDILYPFTDADFLTFIRGQLSATPLLVAQVPFGAPTLLTRWLGG